MARSLLQGLLPSIYGSRSSSVYIAPAENEFSMYTDAQSAPEKVTNYE